MSDDHKRSDCLFIDGQFIIISLLLLQLAQKIFNMTLKASQNKFCYAN
jgi:hypothetical protein